MTEKPCRHFADYKAIRPPKCNCIPCWLVYFGDNPGRFAAVQAGIEKQGREKATAFFGIKYMKSFYKIKELLHDQANCAKV